ncbi:MAG TPA: flagellar basal body P-ring formation chaperone FlgA [Armatimonadota bacterium]|nr:flagellar basal body P-ring formation chaperone FlgA [Armatimonadota bacterium]
MLTLHHKRGVVTAALITALACGVFTPARLLAENKQVQAVLQPSVVVQGTRILLRDLGTLSGDPALAAQAGAVDVGQAPLPGRERQIDLDYIRIRLRQSRIDPACVAFTAPPQVRVRSAGAVLTAVMQLDYAAEALRRTCGAEADPTFRIEPLFTPQPLTLPAGEHTVVAEPLDEGTQANGVRRVRLRVLANGTPVAVTILSLRVQRQREVWVTTRALPAGTLLAATDLRSEQRAISDEEQPLSVNETIVGRCVQRALPAGSTLTAALLGTPPLVRRGDTVSVTLSLGSIAIHTEARSLEDGAQDTVIRVVNGRNGQEYRARVTGPGSVTVVMEEP